MRTSDAHESPLRAFHRQANFPDNNALILAATIPPPPRPPPPKFTPAQIRLIRAIHVDKFSRVFFPFLFTLLNCTYWYMFYEYI